jgi:hypothetical protein
MAAVLRRMRNEGIERGLLGGSRLWIVLGALAWTLRALRWALRRDEQVIYQTVLEPGENLVISTRRPPTRNERRRR